MQYLVIVVIVMRGAAGHYRRLVLEFSVSLQTLSSALYNKDSMYRALVGRTREVSDLPPHHTLHAPCLYQAHVEFEHSLLVLEQSPQPGSKVVPSSAGKYIHVHVLYYSGLNVCYLYKIYMYSIPVC